MKSANKLKTRAGTKIKLMLAWCDSGRIIALLLARSMLAVGVVAKSAWSGLMCL